MNPQHRRSAGRSSTHCPEPDKPASSGHTDPSLGDPPLPIDFDRLFAAEQRLEGGLAEIQAQIWSRLQKTAPGDGEHGARPTASAVFMADQLDSILQNDLRFIVRLIASFGVPASDIDDVTQEVLSAVARTTARYEPSRGKLRTWLYKVAWYQSRTFLGRAYHRREELHAPHSDEIGWALGSMQSEANPERQTIASDTRRLVLELVEQIETNRRTVLIAYEIMEMTMAEIARTLGIPESTGWDQLQRARRELARALRKHRAACALANARKRR
jgi:RNA polymerase sigma-70 factor (ECF subfamily)